jgi:hypothetical protein
MVEETPCYIPWPTCPHSLIPKDAIKRTSCASRRVVHQPTTPFLCSDIDGPNLQCSPLPDHHHRFILPGTNLMDYWCAPRPDPFLFKERKEKKKSCNQTTFSIFKLLSLLTFCNIFDHSSYSFFLNIICFALICFIS